MKSTRSFEPNRPRAARWAILLTLLPVSACTPTASIRATPSYIAHAEEPVERQSLDGGVEVASVLEIQGLDLRTRLGAYRSRGVSWVKGQPIVVGRDYDLALALSIEDAGAGLAAAQRQRANAAMANGLAVAEPIAPQRLFATLANELGPRGARELSGTVRIYGVLYGSMRARLTTVVEVVAGNGAFSQFLNVGSLHDTAYFAQAGALLEELELGLRGVAQHAMSLDASTEPSSASARCHVGDQSGLRGRVAASGNGGVVLEVSRAPFPMHAYCSHASFDSPEAHSSDEPAARTLRQ